MSFDDGGINRHIFVIGSAGQRLEHTLPHTRSAPAYVALVDISEIAEAFRQTSPWYASAIAVQHRVNEQWGIRTVRSNMTSLARQHRFDAFSLRITEGVSLEHD